MLYLYFVMSKLINAIVGRKWWYTGMIDVLSHVILVLEWQSLTHEYAIGIHVRLHCSSTAITWVITVCNVQLELKTLKRLYLLTNSNKVVATYTYVYNNKRPVACTSTSLPGLYISKSFTEMTQRLLHVRTRKVSCILARATISQMFPDNPCTDSLFEVPHAW